MVENMDVGKTRDSISQLLSALEIEQVINVDDQIDVSLDIQDVFSRYAFISDELKEELLPGVELTEDSDILLDRFNAALESLNDKKDEVINNIIVASRTDDSEENDLEKSLLLQKIFPDSKLISISPGDWDKNSSKLLKELEGKKVLLLFDQELGAEFKDGISYIQSIINSANNENLICALLTHTASADDQELKRKQFSNDYELDQDQFMVIAKEWLNRNGFDFVRMLKLAILSPNYLKMKLKVKDILVESVKKADEEISDISILDLDHIIFATAKEEGLWEPDMFFRLHSLFNRLRARELAYVGDLEELASKLRSVNHIPKEPLTKATENTWNIQKNELYEPPEHLNRFHLPLELGDIFKIDMQGSCDYYILLTQQCDLMLRAKNGTRNAQKEVTLVKIVAKDKQPPLSESLPYFGINLSDESFYVKLNKFINVNVDVLDLCVFNDEGYAKYTYKGTEPENLWPSLKKRFSKLNNSFESLVEKISMLEVSQDDSEEVKGFKNDISEKIGTELLISLPLEGKMINENDEKIISYNCQRISRLRQDRAYGILMAYTQCLSRPAFDVDFGINE